MKKIVSALLTLVFLFCFTVPVYAEENQVQEIYSTEEQITLTESREYENVWTPSQRWSTIVFIGYDFSINGTTVYAFSDVQSNSYDYNVRAKTTIQKFSNGRWETVSSITKTGNLYAMGECSGNVAKGTLVKMFVDITVTNKNTGRSVESFRFDGGMKTV